MHRFRLCGTSFTSPLFKLKHDAVAPPFSADVIGPWQHVTAPPASAAAAGGESAASSAAAANAEKTRRFIIVFSFGLRSRWDHVFADGKKRSDTPRSSPSIALTPSWIWLSSVRRDEGPRNVFSSDTNER